MKWAAVAGVIFWVGLAVLLIKPGLLLSSWGGSMYGHSVARVYSERNSSPEGDGGCDKAKSGEYWDCWVETDPGSGPGTRLILWEADGDCWNAYMTVGKAAGNRIDPPRELPPNVYVGTPELSGCAKFPGDVW